MEVLTRQGLMLVAKNNGSDHPAGFDVGGQKIMEVLTRQGLVLVAKNNGSAHPAGFGVGGQK
ncbi:hypothetical protein [Shewanella oncorhynchi]|uniref:hypothetical protein n=1 Tax=Shewanella oncorhynchi TaxID=2726434 RepID=UPI000DEB7057|nr:hypothetical protein [Shewanella oncorhynchi]RBP74830.1 hypothetical protein DET47_12528 [Shewanella putrefaciens]WVI93581.1 hypothetical protein VR487_00870 [Shewanella oncorhynchi]